MRTWRAGIYKGSGQGGVVGANLVFARQIEAISRLAPTSRRQTGFTLIELLVAVSIICITLSFVIPRFMGKGEAELKSAARKMLYAARRLSDDAVFKKEKQTLNVDIANSEYGRGGGGKRSKLPQGVSVESVLVGKEEIKTGTASIAVFPSGFRDEAKIRLAGKDKDKRYTVVIPALGERFEIRED